MKKFLLILVVISLCMFCHSCGTEKEAEKAPDTQAETMQSWAPESRAETPSTEQEEAPKTEPETAEAPAQQPEPEPEPESAPSPAVSETTIRPEFKEAMDSYEAFFDEYVAFMQKFSANSSDLSMLAEYAEFMVRYADAMDKLDKMESEDMTNAELAYYLEVVARIDKKLLTVAS